jgi:CRISPR/Cas system-associated exonuclease Cas4 (RecB family)
MRPFSFSRISTYQLCPLKFKFQYIDRVPVDEQPSPAIERGLAIHQLAEDRLNQNDPQWPEEHAPFRDWLDSLGPSRAEWKLGVSEDLEPEEYDTAYIRGIADIITETTVWDIKTGSVARDRRSVYPDTLHKHYTQASLYGEMELLASGRDSIEVGMYYVDLLGEQPPTRTVTREFKVLHRLKKICRGIEKTVVFPARANRFCNWCPYARTNGGPCNVS